MMTKKVMSNLKAGQRFLYTEGRSVKLLLDVARKPKKDPYNSYCVVSVKILSVMKDSDKDYRIGPENFFTDTGTWTYLEGQDRPPRGK